MGKLPRAPAKKSRRSGSSGRPVRFDRLDQNRRPPRHGPPGTRYTIHRHNLETLPGWDLSYLHDDTLFIADLSVTLARKIGGAVVIALAGLTLLVSVLYWLASREIKRRKEAEEELFDNQKNLENQIRERTIELRKTNEALQRGGEEHRRDFRQLEYSNQTLKILNQILRISQETITLQEFMHEFIRLTSAFGRFGLLPKGALLLVDDDRPDVLRMKAHYNLDKSLLKKCNQVEFGRCLCGRTAESGIPVFASEIDARHETTYENIRPHGHYCIPILSRNKNLLGVKNVSTKPDSVFDKRVEKLLVSVASILAAIIEYKKAGHRIRESHQKHRAITDTAHDAIIMIDHHDKITFWNPAAEKLFGYRIEEVLDQKLHDLIVPESYRRKALTGFSNFVKTGRGPLVGKSVEMTGLKKGGEEFPVELSISALRQGKHWAAISILRDISARKNAEAKERQMELQLRQARKMEAIGTLAGGIAHDFNNILGSILGYAHLVREILTFSRQTEEEVQPLQVGLIIKESLKFLRASLPSNIEIRPMISATGATVLADPTQIHQIIMNPCTNSYQAMREEGGTLNVRLESYTPDEDFRKRHPEMGARDISD